MDPKLYLCIDNCFASKRWTRPYDWMSLIKDIGLMHVEASADTECDPMYMGAEYLHRWILDVHSSSEKTGVKVSKLFSGHGTYATLGLTHTDAAARMRFRDNWIKPHMDTAKNLGAGIGFFAHGIDESILQCTDAYSSTMETLYDDLADIALYGQQSGLSDTGVEQMYSPHQPPWTINGTSELLKRVYAKNHAPIYITLDLGHMNGQQYFQRPSSDKLSEWIRLGKKNEHVSRIWMGSRKARTFFEKAVSGEIPEAQAIDAIVKDMAAHPYLFAERDDCSVYKWISLFACYSPIMHLQQSDGLSSTHWPFSDEKNKKGIIDGKKVVDAIAESYRKNSVIIPQTDSIYLTLEPFISTGGNVYDAVFEIEQSVKYWRQFIPYDGITLSEAQNRLL